MEDEYRLKFDEKAILSILERVKKTIVYEYYKEYNKELELSIVIEEIREILSKGLTFIDVATIQSMEVYDDEKDDLKTIAKLCLQLVFQEIVQSNRNKINDLKKDNDFSNAFYVAKAEIIKYLSGINDIFPTSAIKCLYLLVDGDINPNQQLITAQRLVIECLPYSDTPEQAAELHTQVFKSMLTTNNK